MRVSGARPKRTCSAVVNSSAMRERGKCNADGAVEAAGFVVDFRGVARHCDQITAVVAEVDIALDQAQLLVLGALRIALPVFGVGRRFARRASAAG